MPGGNWDTAMPAYVTRKSADGYTGTVSLPIWSMVLASVLVWCNIIAWGLIGLWKAAETVL